MKDTHKVMQFIDNIEQIAAETPQISGRIRGACFCSATAYILPPCLEALSNSWPDIHLDIDDTATEYHHIDEAVASGRADIGLTIHNQLLDIYSVPYISDAYVFLVPKSFDLNLLLAGINWKICLLFSLTPIRRQRLLNVVERWGCVMK